MLRKSISLNGEWDFCPLADTPPIDELPREIPWETKKMRVPSSWRWSAGGHPGARANNLFDTPESWNSAEAGLIRRTFTAEAGPGQRVFLHFEAVLQRSLYFVNGEKVFSSTEGFLPIEFDISDYLLPGPNELVVWCGSFESIQAPQGKKLLAPSGPPGISNLWRGPWQDVWVEIIPAINIADLAVRTSTRSGQIQAEVLVENRTQALFEGQLSLAVFAGDEQVLAFTPQPVRLIPGAMMRVDPSQLWQDAHLWSPDDPYLYHLQASILDGDETLDTRRLRFGFRELWFEGHKLFLNGLRINLRGDAWVDAGFHTHTKVFALNWYRISKMAGANFVRLHASPFPTFYLDAADEAGMLIVDESAIYGSSKPMLADHPTYIRNCHDHLRALVRRDRSHPSVIIWSMQNEMRWVDGRDGYLEMMPSLTHTMKALDPTRPVSYDGDNRLVPEEMCDIISMHYNIDGTVASWNKAKPLIFGEHGAMHYAAPQVAARYGGPQAYLSFEKAMQALAWSERIFIDYARREEVTGQTPFTIAYYTTWALPEQPVDLEDGDLTAPGVHTRRLPAYSLFVNNGQAPNAPLFDPAPAWYSLTEGLKPVSAIADEYDAHFFAGRSLERGFNIYNDTLHPAQVKLTYHWKLAGKLLETGQMEFDQPPGERCEWKTSLQLPSVSEKTPLTLEIELRHSGQPLFTGEHVYWVYPQMTQAIGTNARLLFLGEQADFALIQPYVPTARRIENLSQADLAAVDVLVIGPNCLQRSEELNPILEPFVRSGGFLLVLEQTHFTLGSLSLSPRTFSQVFINEPAHPVFSGLSDDDLHFWHPANIWAPGTPGLTLGAFNKPSGGDLHILLECGDGDFGWGGLLWSPLLEYRLGQGHVVCSQVAFSTYCDSVPPACLLLGNLLAYACSQARPVRPVDNTLLPAAEMPAHALLVKTGLLPQADAPTSQVMVVDPERLDEAHLEELRTFLSGGGSALVLPLRLEHASLVSHLAGAQVQVRSAPVYQLGTTGHPLANGVSVYDLYQIERVLYTPANYTNTIVAEHCLAVSGGEDVLVSIHCPWEDFFVHGHMDSIAYATRYARTAFTARTYASLLKVGAGRLLFCQVLPQAGNPKVERIYARLLGNLGAALQTDLLSSVRAPRDFAIDTFMVLPQEDYHDFAAMLAYFTDPQYVLNNLGEGVYGWMKQASRQAGAIQVPESAGRTWFMSVFIDSEINRNPLQRSAGQLPDSTIVPDLFLEINCPCRLFINGQPVYETDRAPTGAVKIADTVLSQGINRLVLVCFAGAEDIRFNTWFQNKYGDAVDGLTALLTLD